VRERRKQSLGERQTGGVRDGGLKRRGAVWIQGWDSNIQKTTIKLVTFCQDKGPVHILSSELIFVGFGGGGVGGGGQSFYS